MRPGPAPGGDEPDDRPEDRPEDARSDALAAALAAVRDRVAGACRDVGRDPAALTTVVVTKTFPADDVRRLAALGVHDVGEARDQEAAAKVADCAGLDLRWHFVGRLQSNKAASVARYAAMVHSVDRASVTRALAKGARAAGRDLDVLVQVSLDDDPERGGASAADVPALAGTVAAADGLRLAGVMAVAPLGTDPRRAFDRLMALAADVRSEHPGALAVSAGMSGDLEAAVAAGATHLRVGSAVLGDRPSLG